MTKRIHVIWAHPRIHSLTARVVDAVKQDLKRREHSVTELDLYRERFDPVLGTEDEPDWENSDTSYSGEVLKLFSDLEQLDAVIMIFPVWWYSMPAIMKGYIDRVWNNGLAYGEGHRLPFDHIRWIGIAGASEHAYRKRDLDTMVEKHLNVGIAGFCGVPDSRTKLLYNSLNEGVADISEHQSSMIVEAEEVVRELTETLNDRLVDR